MRSRVLAIGKKIMVFLLILAVIHWAVGGVKGVLGPIFSIAYLSVFQVFFLFTFLSEKIVEFYLLPMELAHLEFVIYQSIVAGIFAVYGYLAFFRGRKFDDVQNRLLVGGIIITTGLRWMPHVLGISNEISIQVVEAAMITLPLILLFTYDEFKKDIDPYQTTLSNFDTYQRLSDNKWALKIYSNVKSEKIYNFFPGRFLKAIIDNPKTLRNNILILFILSEIVYAVEETVIVNLQKVDPFLITIFVVGLLLLNLLAPLLKGYIERTAE